MGGILHQLSTRPTAEVEVTSESIEKSRAHERVTEQHLSLSHDDLVWIHVPDAMQALSISRIDRSIMRTNHLIDSIETVLHSYLLVSSTSVAIWGLETFKGFREKLSICAIRTNISLARSSSKRGCLGPFIPSHTH